MRDSKKMSELIRLKKKKMMEDPDIIDDGGSPREDLQDLEISRQNESTEALDDNNSKERDEGRDQSNAAESKQEEQHSNHLNQNSEDKELSKEDLRKGRLKKRMYR